MPIVKLVGSLFPHQIIFAWMDFVHTFRRIGSVLKKNKYYFGGHNAERIVEIWDQ